MKLSLFRSWPVFIHDHPYDTDTTRCWYSIIRVLHDAKVIKILFEFFLFFQRNIVITVQRQRTHNQSRKLFRLYCYLTNFWNVLALLMYIVLVSAILVRIFNVGQRMEIRIYSLGLFIIYMRFFHSLMVLKYFGLKLIMIGKMVSECISSKNL